MVRTTGIVAVLVIALTGAAAAQTETALFAGGCFWCMEEAFDKYDGVFSTTSGYSGGDVVNPSYEEVTAGGTGHIEVVRVEYDPEIIEFKDLLYVYWRNVDPFDDGGQFCDRGHSYTTAIFHADNAQARAAEISKRELEERFSRTIATVIRPLEAFYPAEDYHQDYYQKNPLRYRFYRTTCRRYERLDEVWGDEARGGQYNE
jgi:peptide-methionine (S)-S-oxide reductase